jgi:hypothetical protein
MDGTQVVVYLANDRQQAFALRNRLAEAGIPAEIAERDARDRDSVASQLTGVEMRVLVDVDDAVRAREIAEAFDRDQFGPDQQWHNWPTCPQCATRRQTFCPICQVSGTNFPIADYNAAAQRFDTAGKAIAESTAGALLMCPTCDEAFTPQFYRRCAQCGHEFAEGIEADTSLPTALNNRVIVAAIILAFLAAGLFAYFQWVLS